MNINLDITKKFNTLVNHNFFFDGPQMNPVLFLHYANDIRGDYEFELMNFGLNISKEMEQDFIKNSPHFDDIVKCKYDFKSLIIFGKVKFNFTGIKGGDVQFSPIDKDKHIDSLYYTWPYKVIKGDYYFSCGSYSSFSPHYILLDLIANNNAKATITFSSDEYMLMDTYSYELEELASSKQSPFDHVRFGIDYKFIRKCTNMPGKMFDFNYRSSNFKLVFEDGFHTNIAVKSEE